MESSLLNNSMIRDAEILLKQLPQLEQQLEHFFIKGVCVRSLLIPKGSGIVGKIHKTEYIAILAKGTMLFANCDGVKEIYSGHTEVCRPGTQNVGYAIEDCTFINVLRTDKTDIDEIETESVFKSFEEYEEALCHLQQH